MELSKYISRCRNPKVITNCRGEQVPVSCYHCPDCQANRLSKLTQKAVNESADNEYTYFITLTYDFENIPTMLLKKMKINNKNVIQCVDVTKRYVNPQKVREYYANPKNTTRKKFAKRTTSTYNQEIHRIEVGFNDELFKEFYHRVHDKGSKLFKPKPFRWLPYLCKEDLQKFLKRLRFQIRKDYNTDIRFFAVGEYTPERFLPHYHICLYFNEPRLTTVLKDIVAKCWQYGRTDCEPALKREGVASYCSSYTNSFTTLPSFLNGIKIKPFSCHSQQFGVLYNSQIRDYVYSLDRYSFEPFNISVNADIRSVSLSSQIAHSFFPRCYNYEYQNAESRYQLYTCYAELLRKYNYKKVSDLTKCVLIDYLDYYNRRLLNSLDLFYDLEELSNMTLLVDKLYLGQQLNDEEITIYNRVYSAINTSKLFDFNLQSPSLNIYSLYNLRHYETRSRYLIKMIDNFYHQKKQYDLSRQFFFEQEYYNRFECDDYDIFYPIGCNGDYKDVYEKNNYIKQFNFEKDKMYRDKVKHKEQNDKNLIFVSNL